MQQDSDKNGMKAICVFCGASLGNDPYYQEVARELGRFLAEQRVRLIYGAGSIGLMGVLADAALAGGGEVTGIIPRHLSGKEILHANLTEVHITDDLLLRKQMMMELSDGFIALPGGLGTFDEILEVFTWQQLKQLDKPIGLVNSRGYFDPFLAMLDAAVGQGFLKAGQRARLLVDDEPLPLARRFLKL